MARILAIDYGTRRTGLAVTDPQGLVAGGLATVRTADLMSKLKDYAAHERVERIIVGWPRQMNGSDSANARYVRSFVKHLEQQMPSIPVELYDERFTSVLAHRTMLDGGLKKHERQNKSLVDQISATIILQSYLESRRIAQQREKI